MKKGFVYLITDWSSNPEKFKVGVTKNNPEDRLRSLQTGSSGELVLLKTYESENYRKLKQLYIVVINHILQMEVKSGLSYHLSLL